MKSKLLGFLFLIASIGCTNENCNQRIDKQTKQLLDELNKSTFELSETPIQELRQMFPPVPTVQLSGIEKIENKTLPQSLVGLRIYTPKHEGGGPLPAFIFIHGGGWILGSLHEYDNFCQEIAKDAGCIVISVDYPLAPEHPFPQPVEDCYFAAQWIEEHIQELGGMPGKIAIGGDSAGGNLAAAVTLMAQEKQGPKFAYQMLICPAMNYNFETLSYFQFAKGYFLTKDDMEFFWNSYLQQPDNGQNPYASPLKAKSLSGLPPACLIISHFDPLRDDGLAYASRLSREGVPTTVRSFNTIHGFYRFEQLQVAHEAMHFISQELRQALK